MLHPILLLLFAVGCHQQAGPTVQRQAPRSYDVAEAYRVYNAILPAEWSVTAAHAKVLVIRTETQPYKMCLKPEAESQQLIGPAISNYLELNNQTWTIERLFLLDWPYDLLSSNQLDAFFRPGGGGWEAFYLQYPNSGGWLEVSAVGFNSDKTVAIVYVGHHCGMLCGGGHFRVLQKKDGNWLPLEWKGSSCLWVS